MTDIHSMTNEQLCEAISEEREPKPTYTPKSVEEAWNNRGWFYDLNNKQWECRPWLMWSWAGILLEEMARYIDNIEIDHRAFEYPPPHICYVIHGIGFSSETDSLRRAICEAWLEWKRNEA